MSNLCLSAPARIHSSLTVHQGDDLTVVCENVTLKNGFNGCVELIIHPDASAVVALGRDNTMVLVRQYRHPLQDYIWEIPSGTAKQGELPLFCARRELEEETGYVARTWQPMGHIRPLPEFAKGKVHLFLASDLTAVDQKLARDELLDVHLVDVDTVQAMISAGDIRDAKTICGYFLALRWLQPHKEKS
jgi:ADP-ribose pyrophosphatase